MCCPGTSKKKSYCGVILWKGRGGVGGRRASRVKAFHDGLSVKLEAEEGTGGQDMLRVAVDGSWLAQDLAIQAVGAVQVTDSICGEEGRGGEKKIVFTE